jgi:hypothetical protein
VVSVDTDARDLRRGGMRNTWRWPVALLIVYYTRNPSLVEDPVHDMVGLIMNRYEELSVNYRTCWLNA